MRGRGRSITLLGPVWRFYRWYDGLDRGGFGEDRFVIFLSLMVGTVALPTLICVTLGAAVVFGQIIGGLLIIPLVLTRLYWLEYSGKGL